MNPAFIPIIFLWIMIFIMLRDRRSILIARKAIEKRKTGENKEMKALAERFMDKDCILYAFDGRQFQGVIKEVTDGAVLLENEGKAEALNLDFVMRIREHPKNKKGQKRAVVLD